MKMSEKSINEKQVRQKVNLIDSYGDFLILHYLKYIPIPFFHNNL